MSGLTWMAIVYPWRWLAIAATALVVAIITEMSVRKIGASRLAPAAGLCAAGLGASIAGLYLFPALLAQSPHPVTISLVGALTYAAFWVATYPLWLRTRELDARGCVRLARSFLLLGGVGGIAAGSLSCQPFIGALYCLPFGVLGGAVLAIPYLVMALHARPRKPDRKVFLRRDHEQVGNNRKQK